MPQELVDSIESRMQGLDSYLHKKELNQLGFYLGQIKVGMLAADTARKFLEVVPPTQYDSNVKKYRNL